MPEQESEIQPALDNEQDSDNNQEVYQMYEELMNLVQNKYGADSDEEEGTQSTSQISRPSAPHEEQKHVNMDKTRNDPGFDSSDSDASEDIGRNVNASPIVQNKGQKKLFGHSPNSKY